MMFGRTKTKTPNRPFAHSDGCKIVKADPGVEIPWSDPPHRPRSRHVPVGT